MQACAALADRIQAVLEQERIPVHEHPALSSALARCRAPAAAAEAEKAIYRAVWDIPEVLRVCGEIPDFLVTSRKQLFPGLADAFLHLLVNRWRSSRSQITGPVLDGDCLWMVQNDAWWTFFPLQISDGGIPLRSGDDPDLGHLASQSAGVAATFSELCRVLNEGRDPAMGWFHHPLNWVAMPAVGISRRSPRVHQAVAWARRAAATGWIDAHPALPPPPPWPAGAVMPRSRAGLAGAQDLADPWFALAKLGVQFAGQALPLRAAVIVAAGRRMLEVASTARGLVDCPIADQGPTSLPMRAVRSAGSWWMPLDAIAPLLNAHGLLPLLSRSRGGIVDLPVGDLLAGGLLPDLAALGPRLVSHPSWPMPQPCVTLGEGPGGDAPRASIGKAVDLRTLVERPVTAFWWPG